MWDWGININKEWIYSFACTLWSGELFRILFPIPLDMVVERSLIHLSPASLFSTCNCKCSRYRDIITTTPFHSQWTFLARPSSCEGGMVRESILINLHGNDDS